MTARVPVEWEIARHPLHLKREVPSATGGNLMVQERAYLRIFLPDGTVGYGEIAPHPLRPPTVEEHVQQIEAQITYEEMAPMPSVLQMAVFDALARRSGLPLWKFLNFPPPTSLETVESFGGLEVEVVMERVKLSLARGIKLKVQPRQPWKEIVRSLVKDDRKIVLDPNCSWSLQESQEAIEWLRPYAASILWVEQPCKVSHLRRRLNAGFPILADEAVDQSIYRALTCYDGVLLKASLQSATKIISVARKARKKGLFMTAGCLLESSLTTAMSVHLSGFFTTTWADLDTVLLVENDPFYGLPRPSSHHISVPGGTGLGVLPNSNLEWRSGGILHISERCLGHADHTR